jgi:hypothetical protein
MMTDTRFPWARLAWLFASAALTTGCVEHMSLLERGSTPTGLPEAPEFWPPPEATSLWISQSAGGGTLGEAAQRIDGTFRDAGYEDQHWYPLGVGYAHGFAVTTRLERTEEGKAAAERWSPLYPEASTLRWLEYATKMQLPARGRYRVFLVAFTDLPFRPIAHQAPRSNEQTLMAMRGMPAMKLPATHRVSLGYRVGVYVYEYASASPDGEGAFVASDPLAALVHVEKSGLEPLGSWSHTATGD